MPLTRLELALYVESEPKSDVSSYSTTRAKTDEFVGFPPTRRFGSCSANSQCKFSSGPISDRSQMPRSLPANHFRICFHWLLRLFYSYGDMPLNLFIWSWYCPRTFLTSLERRSFFLDAIPNRNDRTWTCDLLFPKQAFYQTELHSVKGYTI